MNETREQLLEALRLLASVGADIDAHLIATESAIATQEHVDEQPIQALGGMSREIWDAHKAVQRAIRTTYQYERLSTARAPQG